MENSGRKTNLKRCAFIHILFIDKTGNLVNESHKIRRSIISRVSRRGAPLPKRLYSGAKVSRKSRSKLKVKPTGCQVKPKLNQQKKRQKRSRTHCKLNSELICVDSVKLLDSSPKLKSVAVVPKNSTLLKVLAPPEPELIPISPTPSVLEAEAYIPITPPASPIASWGGDYIDLIGIEDI